MALPMRVPQSQLMGAYDPMWRDFGTMLNRFFGESPLMEEAGFLAPFGVDIREDGDHIYVVADMPGFTKNEIDVSLENQTLTITAEKSEQPQQKGQKGQKPDYLLHERRYQRFVRSFTLPATVDQQHVDAKLQDGILTLTLNKKEEAKPKKIQVN